MQNTFSLSAYAAWMDDRDYSPHSCKIYVDRETGQVLIAGDPDEDFIPEFMTDEEVREETRKVEADRGRYFELPRPNHAMYHEWFRSYLKETGRDNEYFGSIGGWLTDRSEEDRIDWKDYQYECVNAYVREVLVKHGVTSAQLGP